MRVMLLADEGENFEDLKDMRKEVQDALDDAGFDVSAVGVLELEGIDDL